MTGQEFKQHRKTLGLSQEKLGELLGVQKRTIINQEQEETVPYLYEYALCFLILRLKKEELKNTTEALINLL